MFKEKVFDKCKPGHGNIDDPCLVTTDLNDETSFIVRRVHTRTSKQPKLTMRTVDAFRDLRRRPADEEARHRLMPVELPADASIGSQET
jgi:hypothetical protein